MDTGGLGFIGSNLARWLVAESARKTVVDGLIEKYDGNRQRLAELLLGGNQGGVFSVRKFSAGRAKIDIGDYYADDRLIGRVLGWKPRTDLRAALTKTLAYYRKELRHYL